MIILTTASMKHVSALQCRLECESGYVAQKTPLITCVKGEYEKGCHYMQTAQMIWQDLIVPFFCVLVSLAPTPGSQLVGWILILSVYLDRYRAFVDHGMLHIF